MRFIKLSIAVARWWQERLPVLWCTMRTSRTLLSIAVARWWQERPLSSQALLRGPSREPNSRGAGILRYLASGEDGTYLLKSLGSPARGAAPACHSGASRGRHTSG